MNSFIVKRFLWTNLHAQKAENNRHHRQINIIINISVVIIRTSYHRRLILRGTSKSEATAAATMKRSSPGTQGGREGGNQKKKSERSPSTATSVLKPPPPPVIGTVATRTRHQQKKKASQWNKPIPILIHIFTYADPEALRMLCRCVLYRHSFMILFSMHPPWQITASYPCYKSIPPRIPHHWSEQDECYKSYIAIVTNYNIIVKLKSSMVTNLVGVDIRDIRSNQRNTLRYRYRLYYMELYRWICLPLYRMYR